MTHTKWTPQMIAALREMWLAGDKTAAIARKLGVSKNAIVGKANRLDLVPRPSPIKRDGQPPAPRSPRLTVQPLPALRPLVQPTCLPVVASLPSNAPTASAPVIVPIAYPPPAAAQLPPSPARMTACCWPLGEPRTKDFRFCDDPAVPNKPYCPVHCRAAYVIIPARAPADPLAGIPVRHV